MHSLRIDHFAALLEAAHKLVHNRFQLIQFHIEQDQPAAQSVATNAGSNSVSRPTRMEASTNNPPFM